MQRWPIRKSRLRTTINLQCIAMQPESETASEAVLFSTASVLQEHGLLLTPLVDTTHDPHSRQPAEMAATHRDIEAELPAVPQAFFEMVKSRKPCPQNPPPLRDSLVACSR